MLPRSVIAGGILVLPGYVVDSAELHQPGPEGLGSKVSNEDGTLSETLLGSVICKNFDNGVRVERGLSKGRKDV